MAISNSTAVQRPQTSSVPTRKAPQSPPAAGKPSPDQAANEKVDLSQESQSNHLRGTEGFDALEFKGKQLPNLVEAFGGDDIVSVPGQTEVKKDVTVDGGKGNDAVFVGSELEKNKGFHVTDEQGKTVAQNGSAGGQIKLKNVESVFASNTQYGTDGDDKLTSNFHGNSRIDLHETHNIAGGKGNDDISVRTGNHGNSEVNLLPGEGDNKVKFDGGAADDKVFYGSGRASDPKASGSDQATFHGGEGNDELAIQSQNYSLTDKDGKVLSKAGSGADKISADGFEKIWVNGEALKLGS